ncbi:MAG: phosphopantetheine-binding protein [Synergistaceae bacterium]|jgi:acyl carrier protein|nr:phosphopantetheine-binding protein [Synergistaceae bacterium]
MEDLNDLERKITEKMLERLELSDIRAEDVSYTMPLFSSREKGEQNEKSLGLDSVDGLELVVLIYEAWGIKVPANDMPQLTTIGRIADYIRLKHK